MTTAPTAGCHRPGCDGGTIEDGFCNNCGLPPHTGAATGRPLRPGTTGTTGTTGTSGTGSGSGSGSGRIEVTTGQKVRRLIARMPPQAAPHTTRVGEGIVSVPPADEVDPATLVDPNPRFPEESRYCSDWNCGLPVGQQRPDGSPGLDKGFCPHCGKPFDFTARLLPDTEVQGQYKVVGPLTHGGMGWIYLAYDLNLSNRPCVLKGIINPDDDAMLDAVERERLFLAESSHPNIVDIYNFVQYDGQGYIVMQYVGGPSLRDIARQERVKTGKPLPVTQAIAYLLRVLPAFDYFHQRGRVYCDFKPANAIHTGDEVRLIDLGAVRRLDDDVSPIFGTPGYQAPEVPETGPTVAGDLYTIGRSLAVLSLDWPQWRADDLERLPARDDHQLLREHDSLWRFLERACARHPEDRFTNAEEMGDALRGVLCHVAAAQDTRPRRYIGLRWETPRAGLKPFEWHTLSRPILPAHPRLPNRVADIADGEAAIRLVDRYGNDPDLSWADLATTALAYCHKDPGRAAELVVRLDPDHPDAGAVASRLSAAHDYLTGVVAWANHEPDRAIDCFDAAYAAAPGEPACAVAYAAALEAQGTVEGLKLASNLYHQVAVTYRTWVSAIAGLARTLRELDRLDPDSTPDTPEGEDRDSYLDRAATTLLAVPDTHPLRADALAQGCRYVQEGAHFPERLADEAGNHLAATEPRNRSASDAMLAVELCRAALAARRRSPDGTISAKVHEAIGKGAADPHDPRPDLRPTLTRATEAALRELADVTPDRAHRHQLLDEAARVRPWTLW